MPDNYGRGMKWIRTCKRLAIYLRDGMACVWCGQPGTDLGYGLTLDHIRSGNDHTCLVTACNECNAGRGDRPLTREQLAHAERYTSKPLPLAWGKHLEGIRRTIPAKLRPRHKLSAWAPPVGP